MSCSRWRQHSRSCQCRQCWFQGVLSSGLRNRRLAQSCMEDPPVIFSPLHPAIASDDALLARPPVHNKPRIDTPYASEREDACQNIRPTSAPGQKIPFGRGLSQDGNGKPDWPRHELGGFAVGGIAGWGTSSNASALWGGSQTAGLLHHVAALRNIPCVAQATRAPASQPHRHSAAINVLLRSPHCAFRAPCRPPLCP